MRGLGVVWTDEMVECLVHMVKENKSIRTIAKHLDLNKNSVVKKQKELNIKSVRATLVVKKPVSRSTIITLKKLREFYKDNPQIKVELDPRTLQIKSNIYVGSFCHDNR